MHKVFWDAGGAAPDARVALAEALSGKRFVARPLSWVAASNGLFLKVPRRSDSVEADLVSSSACEEAESERQVLCALSATSASVIRPVAQIEACLVLPFLRLVDARTYLKSANPSPRSEVISQCIRCLAEFHRANGGTVPVVKAANYHLDRRHPADADTARRLSRLPVVPVVRGGEIRNFFLELPEWRVRFGDPHEVVSGVAEEDVARFAVSLLMMDWGRRVAQLWTKFDVAALLSEYAAHGRPLDRPVLRFMMQFNLAIRERHALEGAASMPPVLNRLAAVYVRRFFGAARHWSRLNGF